ncbi:glycosyltransferase family 2 protein [Pararhodobacter sp.]|uniref:glycosyltransferase family 2 protein n=1 Tax=Pararhodobacter sp. TaxID=2127056 RepID=UPI002B003E33|nr:glycosyltransferase family 2 protein [Pararhodobacter sp.]
MPERPLISIVIPCLDEMDVLPETLTRLSDLARSQATCDFEFIFVDDGSRDATLAVLAQAARTDPRLRILSFSRNFGQQIAVTAGIDVARGDAVVLMDSDLQDPPEVVAQMIARWHEGFDVVYGLRASRPGDSWFKRFTANGFYSVISRLSQVAIPADTGDFRLMSRPVVEVLKQMPERHRFLRGMVAWTGFRQTSIAYDRPERFAGATKYPLTKMIRYALDGILSFSIKPLQLAVGLGLMTVCLSVIGIIYALILRIFTSVWVEGWTALMIAVLFLGGVQLLSLGIIGEYIGRIYAEVQRRPLYVVRNRIGFDPQPEGAASQPETATSEHS